MFTGKKLLILGNNAGVSEIISYAQKNGAYVIATDYLKYEDSLAKQLANEYLMIDTSNTEELIKYIKENNIDGVLSGISEFNIYQALVLSEECSLPFFCNKVQWEQVENKGNFRELCLEFNVPAPKRFFYGNEIESINAQNLNYPVVVKPVDSESSKGVSFCYRPNEIKKAVNEAVDNSKSKRIIIEEFIEGSEFTATYTIADGIPTLSCVDNRYPVAINEGKVSTIPIARIYPSLFLDEYIKQVDDSMKSLINSLGLENAVLFVQGIYNPDKNSFSLFEAGLRPSGELPSRFITRINGNDYLHLLTEQVLMNKNSSFVISKEDPYLNGYSAGVVSFATKGGEVGNISGLSDVLKDNLSILDHEVRYPVGAVTPSGNTLRQLILRFVLLCSDRKELSSAIEDINNKVTVLDKDGHNMVLKFSSERLEGIE